VKIEIKNLKIAASLSEETTAYTADIFVDGVKTFAASNHGHGACDMFHRYATAEVTEREVNAFLADNCPPDGPWTDNAAERPAYDMGHTCDLENFVGRHVAKAEAEKETARIRRTYAKKLTDRICALRADPTGDVFLTFGKAIHKPTPENLAKLRRQVPEAIVLNDADEATKERGLRAFCPEIFSGSDFNRSEDQLREAVFERLRTDALTVADAKWLLASPQNEGRAPDPDVDAHLRDVVAKGEAAYAAYCSERDTARNAQNAAYDAACKATGQVS
jgi:hypothetical protein